jgi:hypothetical protein
MGKSIRVNTKRKRGRPKTTGKGELVGVRLQPVRLAALDRWISQQEIVRTRPEAIRHLMDLALSLNATSEPMSNKAQEKAAELASKEIDKLKVHVTDGDKQHQRKRHLIKGPMEFRELRGRQANAK